MSASIEIRSFRRVFDLERRIYSIDRLRLNPGGVPIRGVIYFLALVLCGLIAGLVPLMGVLARSLPWYMRDLVLPAAIATVLSAIRIEGRTFHLAALALARHALEPTRLAGCDRAAGVGARWCPQAILMLPDGSDGRLRRFRYTGPGAVLICMEHERRGRASERGRRGTARPGMRAALVITEREQASMLDRGEVVVLGAGSRLLVRSRRDRGR
jgi:hypothetical protein